MKEIKFRVWDTDLNKWYDGVWIAENNELTPADSRYVIQMYTGLKDKNGKEIYEGDILSWETVCGEHQTELVENMVEFLMAFGYDYYESNATLAIVGNIYENRELLDGAE